MMKDGGDTIVTSVVLEESVMLPDLKNIPDALPYRLAFFRLA